MGTRLAVEMPAPLSRTGEATLDLPRADGQARGSVFLHGGQVYTSTDPSSVVTILGSRVAVCLFDRESGVGGMNHFLLPHATERQRSPRFGAFAMPHLVQQLLEQGARREGLEAKVFGGACIIGAFPERNLGAENVELALKALGEAGVPVVERDVGGRHGRKLVFHTDVGAAWVLRL